MTSLDDLIEHAGDLARPFWTALQEGRLDVPHCRACDRSFFFPRRFCPTCYSADVTWRTASGRATVFAYTVVHVPFPGLDGGELPVATGLVDLDEGVRLPARFRIEALPTVGEAVVCTFDIPRQLPVFLPLRAGSAA